MIVTSTNLAALNKGFRTLYSDAFQGGGATPRVESYALRTTSTSAEEFYGWLAAVPGLRELLGEIVIRNITDLNFSIKNREFESTIGVKRKDIERDNFGMYNMLFTAMGTAARNHPDELLFERMIAGFTSPCYTGKNFFDADHEPIAGKQKFSNKGTKKLSAANFQIARANIKSRRNTEGKPMNLGNDLVLVVSPDNESNARSIVVADKVGGGNDNVNKGTARLDVCPLLSSAPDAWFLLDLGYPLKPFINQVEVETEFQSLTDAASAHVLLLKEYLYQAYRRGNVGYGLPELAYGSTGADAA
jgi:phage major head subunit gpT-like protein